MRCAICNKRVFFFNRFKREYGLGAVYDKKTMKPLGCITFCSKDCYKKTLNPEEYDKQYRKSFYEEKGRFVLTEWHKKEK